RHRPALLRHEVRERQTALPPGEASLVDHLPVALQRDSTDEKNLRLRTAGHSLPQILPRSWTGFLASPRGVVDKVLHCDCGFEVRSEGEAELVAAVRRHAWEAHWMALSHDEALLLTFRAELDEEAPSTIPRRQTTHTDEEET